MKAVAKRKRADVGALLGGLGNGHQDNNGAVLEMARQKLVKAGDKKKKMSLAFLDKKAEAPAEDEDRLPADEAQKYVDDIADRGYKWIIDVAKPFLRTLETDIVRVGSEILDDLCSDNSQTNRQRQEDYESAIEVLKTYGPEDDEIIKEELASRPARSSFFNKLFDRIHDCAKLALLVDDLRNAADKEALEDLLQGAMNSSGKKLFVEVPGSRGPIRAFKGKSGDRTYNLLEGAFGAYHDFAVSKLAEAVSSRKNELFVAYKAEAKRQREGVFNEVDTDVSPEDLLFGDPDDMNEKTALFTWKYEDRTNGIRVRRSGDRLYWISAFGRPMEFLDDARAVFSDPHVLLNDIVDGDCLCLGEGDGNSVKYLFSRFIKEKAIFNLARWLRVAAGKCLPSRLQEGDVDAVQETEGSDLPPASTRPDSDGTEPAVPAEFFQRYDSAPGTLVISLPEKFTLNLPEAKDENQEVVVEARQVVLKEGTKVHVRRLIADGKSRIVLEGSMSLELSEALRPNSVIGVAWQETGKDNWQGLPAPIPSILAYGYKLFRQGQL